MEAPGTPRGEGRRRVAAAAGSIWGLATYGVLWEGTPVEVSRAFVDGNPIATLLLLPSRVVIWTILGAESLIGRTFDLSTNYVWIAPAAAVVGAVLARTVVALVWRAPRRR